MKDTLIPLSTAYLDKDGVILEMYDMKALDKTIIKSKSNHIFYVLETNLGWFSQHHIQIGNKVLPPPNTLGVTAIP